MVHTAATTDTTSDCGSVSGRKIETVVDCALLSAAKVRQRSIIGSMLSSSVGTGCNAESGIRTPDSMIADNSNTGVWWL